ncbi:SPW repeat protein [Streptomyces sp. NBC_01803]|uniref:SPW repeat protein n=1 Tax=Streptomyces sp. NBC_01803 TaxID=2975946 RepID=UPI002DD7C482|nr:SPW repeat protein [Streptomyces sp. NBC_01803]WSA46565.1 SPW repeat protein [Streptomyces sp. NBC_01803]
MTDVSHRRRADLAGHPDEREMRERYSRVLGGRDVVFVDGPLFLAGLYAALSPWAVHFNDNHPDLSINNLIVGIAVALLALGFTRAPERMYGMSHALWAMGAWLIISPWLVGDDPGGGLIASNIITGAIIFLLGLVGAAAAMKATKKTTGAAHKP